jgi:hypothetical protein
MGSDNLNLGTQHIPCSRGTDQPEAKPVLILANLIEQYTSRAIVVEDEDISIAIIINIAKGGATANLG